MSASSATRWCYNSSTVCIITRDCCHWNDA